MGASALPDRGEEPPSSRIPAAPVSGGDTRRRLGRGDAPKRELDEALQSAGLDPRARDERISLPVPTWSIESWLLALSGREDIDEKRDPGGNRTWKLVFEQDIGDEEGRSLAIAAETFRSALSDSGELSLPSLTDGRDEMNRITG